MSDLIHLDLLRGFVVSALLATRLSNNDDIITARIALLMELDAAFRLDIDKLNFHNTSIVVVNNGTLAKTKN